MRRWAIAISLLPLVAGAENRPAVSSRLARLCPTTRLGTERLVLATTLGELTIALYPEVAPGHAQAVARLARLGVYDGTPFYKVDPRFGVQLAGTRRRAQPLTPDQQGVVRPLIAEFNGCPHRRGTVTMAHDPGNPNSAQTSFLLMFSDVPQMNGKFTVIGEVVGGEEVLQALERLPTRPGTSEPLRRVDVIRATVRAAEATADAPAAVAETGAPELPVALRWLAIVLTLTGVALRPWRRDGVSRAAGMLFLLGGYFGLFVWFGPMLRVVEGAGIAVLASAIGLFRLMTRFENPAT